MADTSVHYYPLTKMNFVVVAQDVAGVAAFTEVTGIEATVDVVEFRQGNAASLAPVKIPGLVKHGNITLKMGYVSGQGFKDWVMDCVSDTRPVAVKRLTVTIELIDISEKKAPQSPVIATNTAEHKIWTLKNAWVAKYTGPDLNASVSEVAIETMELAYEEITLPN